MSKIRNTLLAVGTALLAGTVLAQPAAPDGTAPAPGKHDRAARMAERFKAADANNDGKLTKDEAKSMPMVYKHFDEIDVNHTGAVSMADIAAYAKAHRASMRKPAPPAQ